MNCTSRNLLFSTLFCACFATTTPQASPLLKIGDSVDVFIKSSVGMRFDSNVFLTDGNEKADLAFILSPGFEIVAGRDSNTLITLNVREDINLFVDNSGLNSSNTNFRLDTQYDGGAITKLQTTMGYQESKQNTLDARQAGALIKTRNYDLGFMSTFRISERTSLDNAIRFEKSDYRNLKNIYHDRSEYMLPITLYYSLTEKLDLGAGYQFRYTDVHSNWNPFLPAHDRTDHFVYLAGRGSLTEKLKASLRLGYTLRRIHTVKTEHNVGLDSSLEWMATTKLAFLLGLTNDYETDGIGNSYSRLGFNALMSYNFSEKFIARWRAQYFYSDYHLGNRHDHFFGTGPMFIYAPNNYLRFSLDYTFSVNESNQLGSDFNNHTVNVQAAIKY